MLSYFYLDQRALEKLREFFASQPEVVFAAVLGSLASRGFSFHDVDVAVKLMCEDKYAHLSRILDSVAKLFGSDLGSIDLVDLDRADVGLKKRVITEGLVLVDKGYVKEVVEELSNILPEYDEYLSLSIREWLTSRDPTSIDLELIKKRVGFIKSEVSFLKEHVLSKSPLEVSGSPILKRLLERSYHLVVEAFVDICRHIASVKGWRPSFTAREFIESCGSHGVINGELSSRLIEALKLRNIIIHRYMEIDYDRLYAEARSLVRLAEDFEKQLIAFLKKEAQQP
ncbi:MAG: DUF86 domain-containing protein [Candidatus Nezhaarchaeota archaeon]|nr:DUF86 domain-containing protein [Candidatus Nezhaarchaeota archaeon]